MLACEDKELNQWVSLKKAVQIRYISFSHAIGFCFDEQSAALLSSCMHSLIGPRPSDYPHALSACYYFLQAVFLLPLGLWSSLPARQLCLDTSYSFLTFSVFFFFFFFKLKG